MTERLITYSGPTEPTALEDLLMAMAMNVENALVISGAEPGKDYTLRDLFTWGLPFAQDVWMRSGKGVFQTDFSDRREPR